MLAGSLKPMINELSRALKCKSNSALYCRAAERTYSRDVQLCHSITLGYLVSAVDFGMGLSPNTWSHQRKVRRPDTYATSIKTILDELESTWKIPSHNNDVHRKCNPFPRLLLKFRNLLSRREEKLLPEEIIDYMAKKRAIFGDLVVPDSDK